MNNASNYPDPIPEFPLHIQQGADFDHTLNWYGGGKFIAPIEDLEVGYPTIITVTGHGLNATSPTPVVISGADGLDDEGRTVELRNLNSVDTGIDLGSRVDDNRFSMPVSTVGEIWKPGTGEITYWRPSDIDGWSGELRIRKNWHSQTILHTISTALGTMTLDGSDGSIRLQIPASVTAGFAFFGAVYDLDLDTSGTFGNGTITRVFRGPVKLHRDM